MPTKVTEIPPSSHESASTRRQKRRSSTTGVGSGRSAGTRNREEITPWEFQPLPHQSVRSRDPPSPTFTSSDAGASPRRPKSSSASLVSVSLLSMPPPAASTTITTGPVAEVTPWDLYPAPSPWSTSASYTTTSTSASETRNNTRVASPSASSLAQIPGNNPTNTGPVDEVTPWELAPGPQERGDGPPSPTSNKFVSLFKSNKPPSSKLPPSLTTSPKSPYSTPLPDVPFDLLTAYGTMGGVPPIALQSKSISQWSERRDSSSKHSVQSGGGFKWTRPGSKGGKDRKDSTSSSNAGVVERSMSRQLPLTGPVEEVAPWEMVPPTEEAVVERISLGNRALLAHIALTSSPPMSPTIEMWNAQKSAGQSQADWVKGTREENGYYTSEDGRSMSSSALPLSRARRDSVTAAVASEGCYMINGERTQASSASLPLGSTRDGQNGTIPKGDEGPRTRQAVSRGRSLTGQTVTLTKSSVVRPASASAALTSGHGNGNGEKIGAGSVISTMNKAQMEAVLPWELYPIPKSIQRSITTEMSGEEKEKDRNTAKTTSSSASASASTSTSTTTTTTSAAGKALVELGLKKRKSTGKTSVNGSRVSTSGMLDSVGVASSSKAISNVSAPISSTSTSSIQQPQPQLSIGQTLLPISFIPSNSSTSSSQSRGTRNTPSSNSINNTNNTNHNSTQQPPSDAVDLAKLSTVDRTILEEFKANIQTREAQFLIKGVGHTMVGGRRCPGKKYHPFRKGEVPYPRSYDKEVVDLDVWETMFWLDLCKGLSWHSFDRPPTKVLEIGCGTGTWILQAATTWEDSHFVGLDIVPLHPNLQNFNIEPVHTNLKIVPPHTNLQIVPSDPNLQKLSSLDSRITWVQHNFLDGLPFLDEEFDFVHIKRIALGIPEDKWDKFLEEVQRVMKPGGALEMIEEDLFFPGKPADDNEDEPNLNADSASIFSNETLISNGTVPLGLRPMPQIDEQRAVKSFSDHGEVYNTMGKFRPTQSMFDPLEMSENVAPRNPRDHGVLETIWKGMLESRFVNSTPLSLLPTYLEYHFQDVRTHPPLLYSYPPLPTKPPATTETKLCTSSLPEHNSATTSQPLLKTKASSSLLNGSDTNNPDDGSTLSTTQKNPSNNDNKHRSHYVLLDETRSDALSPSALSMAPSPKRTKSHIATLPNRTSSIDIRTLNLHLSLRAKEIVGCSEPMWEWVKEFQAKKKKGPRRMMTMVRSDSIEVALLGSSMGGFNNGRDKDLFIKDAILEMTRDDFDQILTNFQLDMQDKASIKDVLEQRFDWRTFTSEPLPDRKAFDRACQRYDEWVANETRNQLGHGPSKQPYHSRNNDLSILPIAEEVPGFSTDAVHSSMAQSRLPRELSSCQQLSRAMRVFVAWKESA